MMKIYIPGKSLEVNPRWPGGGSTNDNDCNVSINLARSLVVVVTAGVEVVSPSSANEGGSSAAIASPPPPSHHRFAK